MSHEIAKLLLEHAENVLERTEAVRTALRLGMPLHEIEEYLDWVEMMKSQRLRVDKKSNTKDKGDSNGQLQKPH